MIWNGGTTKLSKKLQKKLINMSTAQDAILTLLSGQCEATARTIAAKFDLNIDECLKEVATHVKSIDLASFKTAKKRRGKKSTRQPAAQAERCLARVWGTGSGNDQCKLGRCDKSDYCKRHDKAVQVESTPCTLVPWTEESRCGKKTGLFCGRIDQNIPVADSHGVIRILWKNPNVVKDMEQKIAGGEWRMPTGLKPKRQSKKAVAAAQPAGPLKKAVAVCKVGQEATPSADIDEAFNASKYAATLKQALSTLDGKSGTSKVSVEEMNEVFGSDSDNLDGGPASPVVVAPNGLVEDSQHEELANMVLEDVDSSPSNEEEEEISCEEREHNGTVYLVEPSSNTIYNEDGMEIGTWTKDGPKLN